MNKIQQYSATEMERMMKLQDVLLKAMAKKITWWQARVTLLSVWAQFPKPGRTYGQRKLAVDHVTDLLRKVLRDAREVRKRVAPKRI